MTRRAFVPRDAPQIPCFGGFALAIIVVAGALAWQTANASSTDGPVPPTTNHAPSNTINSKLPTITIEARRELQRQVNHFVSATVVQSLGESLMRWDTPICSLVEGLPQKFDAFIQTRISQIALSAGAPVAGKQCAANLYVFATGHPERLLKKLWAYNPWMFDTRLGVGRVERFVHSRRPVRVWYNTKEDCRNATSSTAAISAMGFSLGPRIGTGGPLNSTSPAICASTDSRMNYGSLQSVLSVFIVVNMNRMKKTTTQQLADYVAMVGLADVRLSPYAGAVHTILRLFQHPRRLPKSNSKWDQALLYSLYNTHQSSVLQMSDMEATVMKRITRPRIPNRASSHSSKYAIPLWVNEVLPQRDAKAVYWYHIGADDSNRTAQYDLAVKYVLGQGVPQSYTKAAKWYRKAAEQGYVDAQFDVGLMYATGEGVPRDYAKAAQWYRKAARQGDVGAQSSLGLAYAKGRGVPRNYAKAMQWFHKAAKQGSADAQFDLGVLYANGQGVPRDPVSALKWWIIAKTDASFIDDVYDWSVNRMKKSTSRMTADQIARARREASQWLATHRSRP